MVEYQLIATDEKGAVIDAGQGSAYYVSGMAAALVERAARHIESIKIEVTVADDNRDTKGAEG